MSPRERTVKRARPYDASQRRDRAAEKRDTTLEIARSRFLAHGYAATTVHSIAAEAGISEATIYKSYGGKAGLVRALAHDALRGSEPVAAEERSNFLRSESPRVVIEGWGRLTAEVSPRISPILLLLRDAATSDPDAAALHRELDGERLDRMADNARYLAQAGSLRPERTQRDARDVLWLCSSPELYDLLVRQRGWTIAKYSRFVADTITSTLL